MIWVVSRFIFVFSGMPVDPNLSTNDTQLVEKVDSDNDVEKKGEISLLKNRGIERFFIVKNRHVKITKNPIYSNKNENIISPILNHSPPVSNATEVSETLHIIPDWTSKASSSAPFEKTVGGARPSLSSWLLIRTDQSTPALSPTSQLGGSQIGARLVAPIKTLSQSVSVTLSAKLTSAVLPLRQSEVAIGFGLQHRDKISAEINVEHRFKLNQGGRNAVSLTASVGQSDLAITEHLRASGYIQAGIVGIKAKDLFADLAINVEHDLAKIGHSKLFGGGGTWAAAQPGATRLDVGPQLSAKIPIAKGGLRISAEYRFRIGGNARPQSGPSLSISHYF